MAEDAVEAHQFRAGAVGGVVGVNDDDLVAMAHGAQDVQQVGAEDGWNVLEHQSSPLSGGVVVVVEAEGAVVVETAPRSIFEGAARGWRIAAGAGESLEADALAVGAAIARATLAAAAVTGGTLGALGDGQRRHA